MKGSGEAMEGVILPVTTATPVWWLFSDGSGRHIHGGMPRQKHPYNGIKMNILDPLSDSMLLPWVLGVMGPIHWLPHPPDLNPIEHLGRYVVVHPMLPGCTQAVQRLSDVLV